MTGNCFVPHSLPDAGFPRTRETTMSDASQPTHLSDEQRTALEAAAFRRLVNHLRERTDVQNIDMMNLAGFCRNCLSNWYREEAEKDGIALSKDASRELVYGMPYEEWRARYQTEATPQQKAAFSSGGGGH
jgi:uncharacterized protein